VKNESHTISTGQSTHQDLFQKCGLRCILFDKSCLWRIFFIKNLACGAFFVIKNLFNLGCICFEVSYSVYHFISGENDSNSNTEWSQRHNLFQTVITKVSNNKLFVKSNLLRYKSHNTISIPKQFIRNNVHQGKFLTQSLQILALGNHSLLAGNKSFPPDATLCPQPRPPTPANQYLSQNKNIQWLVPPSSLPSATNSYDDCLVRMHFECKESYSSASVDSNPTRLREALLLT